MAIKPSDGIPGQHGCMTVVVSILDIGAEASGEEVNPTQSAVPQNACVCDLPHSVLNDKFATRRAKLRCFLRSQQKQSGLRY